MLRYVLFRELHGVVGKSEGASASEPGRVRAWGRGLQSRGVRIGDKADFKVYTDGAGEGTLEIRATGPSRICNKINSMFQSTTVLV